MSVLNHSWGQIQADTFSLQTTRYFHNHFVIISYFKSEKNDSNKCHVERKCLTAAPLDKKKYILFNHSLQI